MITIIKLDYTIESPQERLKLVEQILAENPDLNETYLESLAKYLVLCMESQEKKEKKILTENRLATITKRETSYEGLVSHFENGEDGVYNLMANNKNAIFKPKISITKKDLEDIPDLRQKRSSIEFWENALKTASGRDAYIIKQTIIELRKDQYLIKDAYRRPIKLNNITRSQRIVSLPSNEWVDENDEVCYSGVSLCDPKIIEITLCYYPTLKSKSEGRFMDDTWYYLQDFENIYNAVIEKYPLYKCIVECKWNGLSNIDIQHTLEEEFGFSHSLEYISSLWRNKIPKLIATQAQNDFLVWWHTNVVRSNWKKCTRCGQIKLAHNRFFSINKTSKDGFYSICKECRNKKKE